MRADPADVVLLAVAVGDALGMPVEGMTPSGIRSAVGVVEDFIAPVQTRFADTMDLPAGVTIDDWQLLVATMRSLARPGRTRPHGQWSR